jgi:hypothetical protein
MGACLLAAALMMSFVSVTWYFAFVMARLSQWYYQQAFLPMFIDSWILLSAWMVMYCLFSFKLCLIFLKQSVVVLLMTLTFFSSLRSSALSCLQL